MLVNIANFATISYACSQLARDWRIIIRWTQWVILRTTAALSRKSWCNKSRDNHRLWCYYVHCLHWVHYGPLVRINVKKVAPGRKCYIHIQGCWSQRTGGWVSYAHSVFGWSVNPVSTKGEDYAYHITFCPSRFFDLPTALIWNMNSSLLLYISKCAVRRHFNRINYLLSTSW